MNRAKARQIGQWIAADAREGRAEDAYVFLIPLLAQRTPFALLRLMGAPTGAGPLAEANALIERIAQDGSEGGWVVIQSILCGQLDRDLGGALDRCRRMIITADVWYAADTLGEGVAGQALVDHFAAALAHLAAWREDGDAWVRRAVGAAVHFWAKRSRGRADLQDQAQSLLDFLAPLWEEWDLNAAKGVGWGIKTLGRTYPELVTGWLVEDIMPAQRRHRAVMLRKALTYLSEEQRARVQRTSAGP